MSIAETKTWNPTAEEYFADTERISCSMLKVFMRSRREFEAYFVAKTLPQPEPTAAMQLGTLLHECVFDPAAIDRLAVAPKVDGRTKEGKAIKAEFAAQSVGKTVVDAEQYSAIIGMIEMLKRTPAASRLLWADGLTEHVLTSRCETTMLPLKGRLDKLLPWCIVDLKTCSDPSEAGFANAAARLKYHCQGAFYRTLAEEFVGETLPVVFVAICPEPPYRIGVYEMHEDGMDLGRFQNIAALSALKDCYEHDDFSEPAERQIVTLKLPRWTEFLNDWSIA